MHLFYHPYGEIVSSSIVTLIPEESFHSAKVLRLKNGEMIRLTDGRGNLARGIIQSNHPSNCVVEIGEVLHLPNPVSSKIHIAIAPPKNIDRLEWFLEKVTEIGISDITPIWCEHSERKSLRHDRLQKILVAAMKQSQRIYLPALHPALPLPQFTEESIAGSMQKFLAYAEERQPLHLINAYQPHSDCVILIGPEGDFSPEEIKIATRCGFTMVSLGSSRLRTETAGLYACALINIINER